MRRHDGLLGLEERDREKIPFKGQQPAAYIILTHLIKKLHNLGKICRICNAKSMLVGVIQLRQIALDSMDPFELQLTVFANRVKSFIQHCERSELRFYFDRPKVY